MIGLTGKIKNVEESCQGKDAPSFGSLVAFLFKLGLISFGGPAGQVAILREELVVRRRWMSTEDFAAGLNFCLLLPGPEAHQLAIYSGWKLHGTRGAIAAALLFVLPSALLLWGLSVLYVNYGQQTWAHTILETLRPAVLAIIVAALIRMAMHHLNGTREWVLAVAAFGAMFHFGVAFPWIVLTTLGLGALRRMPQAATPAVAPLPEQGVAWRPVGIALALWAAPIAALAFIPGIPDVLAPIGLFFSKAALVTFGGAYAVLPYVTEHAVMTAKWLSPGAMMDGLALAEPTPGPLIIVLQFVGFLAGWNDPSPWSPLVTATCGAILATWVTFLPSFIFILIGAPYIARISRNPRARSMLATVSAAVVGVIANLAAWFATGLFAPGSDWVLNGAIAVGAFWLLTFRQWSIPVVVIAAAAAGCARAFWL